MILKAQKIYKFIKILKKKLILKARKDIKNACIKKYKNIERIKISFESTKKVNS